MRGLVEEDEELASVGVLTSIGHGEETSALVLLGEVLIVELGAIDGLSTGTVSSGEVTTLSHESWDDSVELAVLEVKSLARFAVSLLSSAQCSEVLSCQWGGVSEELEHNTFGLGTDLDVKEDLGVCHLKFTYLLLFNMLSTFSLLSSNLLFKEKRATTTNLNDHFTHI